MPIPIVNERKAAMKKIMMAVGFAAMVVAAGCDDVIPARELVKRTGGDKVNTIMWTYYIGSENGCDCFCHEMMGLSASLPCPSVSHKTYYAVRSSEFPTFTRRFHRTDDRTKWVPVMFKEDWRGVEILTDDGFSKRLDAPLNHVNETRIERSSP